VSAREHQQGLVADSASGQHARTAPASSYFPPALGNYRRESGRNLLSGGLKQQRPESTADFARQESTMRQQMKFLVPTLAASVLLSACGSSSSKSTSSATESQPAATQTSASGSTALVKTASNSTLGARVLVDAQGMTLYHLSGEQNGKFICTAACLQVWHPLAAQAGGTPSGTVGSLATVKRSDGTEQVTYKGTPLYTFAQDETAGQAKGQGIKDVGTWSAVTTGASSTSAPASTPASTPAAPATSGGGGESSKGSKYGY
jgi:predicted lipoprotein with Yx(FWY)xxD motif